MLWEKGKVNTYKHDKELSLGTPLPQCCPRDRGKSESHSSKDCEDGSYREDVVEVGYDVIGVMQCDIQRAVS